MYDGRGGMKFECIWQQRPRRTSSSSCRFATLKAGLNSIIPVKSCTSRHVLSLWPNDLQLTILQVGTSLTNTQVRGADPAFKNPKSLSGGERSFSTVALLLAMWDITSSPMRCLDEWDVFLDHVNRGIAANMLIEGARHSSGKQFILITPQVSLANGAVLCGVDQSGYGRNQARRSGHEGHSSQGSRAGAVSGLRNGQRVVLMSRATLDFGQA